MSRILLTGSSGFIGSNVLSALMDADHDVMCPVRGPDRLKLTEHSERMSFLSGTFYDKNLLKKYSEFGPDIILHLAAIRGAGQGDENEYHTVNVQGTRRLVDIALENKIKLFVYCSTVGIYGTIPADLPAGPSTPQYPDGQYHLTKFEAEKLIIQNLHREIPFIILRPTITYGPGDNGFLPRMIRMIKNKSFPLIREDVRIHLLDVQTLVKLLTYILDRKSFKEGIYNVADQAPIKLSELVNLISNYYHDRDYPAYLKMPRLIFNLAGTLVNLLNLQSLGTSIKLISKSWYYNISDLKEIFPLPLKNSLEAIGNYLNQGIYDRSK